MKNLHTLFAFSAMLFLFLPVWGQECGMLHVTPASDNYAQPNGTLGTSHASNFCIDLQIYIVRNSDGSNAFDPPNITLAMNNLNEIYNTHGIYFNLLPLSYINDSRSVYVGTEWEAILLMSQYNNPNALCVYVVDSMWSLSGSGPLAGTAFDIPSSRTMLIAYAFERSTFAHEIGHCLHLYHTFRGTSARTSGSAPAERIDGSNCHTAADKVCDTPADPDDLSLTNYSPDLTNLMSYYRPRDHITEGQAYRVREALLKNSLFQNIQGNACTVADVVMTGPESVCPRQSSVYELVNLPPGLNGGANPFWTSSDNISFTTISSTEVSVRFLSSGEQEGTLTARITVNGISYWVTKRIKQLSPPLTSAITLESFQNAPLYTNQFNTVTARYNGDIDGGVLAYSWEWVVPSSSIQNQGSSYSYIKVQPNFTYNTSIYIKTRTGNQCGTTSWVGKWFPVEYRTGRGRGGVDY
ncbi:MAG: M43 family zinc metalloprotease [Bacteroidia bacterium]|nr:M43 family zinc metalloprotease [Bacteroidia bacterium]